MGVALLDQRNYNIGEDNNADPDLCTWDGNSTPRTGQAKESNFMVRLQVAEDSGNASMNKNWQLYYNTSNDPDTATQVTTISAVVAISNGTPADQDPTTENVCDAQVETRQNGLFTDASDESGKFTLAANFYTEFQFCVQFDGTAGDGTDYYFFLFYDGSKLNGTYDNVAKVTTVEAALIDNLISYYKLDESSGAVIDSHGSNNGTNFNATPNVAGKINTAYDFDLGDFSNYINLTDMDYVTANRLTVSAWVNPESTGHSTAVVVAHSETDSTRAFHLDSTGTAPRFLTWNSTGTIQQATASSDISLGNWHHLVGVWDGTNINLYVDGVKAAVTGQTGTIRNETAEVTIGNSGLPAHGRWWDGEIDEVGIWSRALTDGGVAVTETAGGEIAKLYNSGNGLAYPFVAGPANLLSVNAVTTANIKSINAVVIGSVKSINAIA